MCKNLDSPHPLTPSPKDGRRGTRIMSPLSQNWERGWGQYSSVKPKNLGKDAKFRVSTGLKLVPKILN